MKTFQQSIGFFLLSFFFTGLFTNNMQAQTDFKLSDYKNPDYHWRALDFQLGLSGNNSFSKNTSTSDEINKSYYNRFNGDLSADYFSVKNSVHYQGIQNIGFGFTGYANKNRTLKESTTNSESTQRSRSSNLDLNVYLVNRFYNNKKRFFEVDLNFNGNLANSNNKKETDPATYSRVAYQKQGRGYEVSATVPLLIGTGRIEEVQDARLAVYILDDLQKAGDLTRTASKDDILAFAQFITQVKNQRFFDSRIRKIEEITAVDSFLIVRGLKAKSDASYYTLLTDNWDNSAGPIRSAGRRFSFGLEPGYNNFFDETKNYYRDTLNGLVNETNTKSSYLNNNLKLNVVAHYVCEKPLNLYWQQSTSANLAYSLSKMTGKSKHYENGDLTLDDKEVINNPNLGLDMGYSLAYYPNSRTSISMNVFAKYIRFWEDEKLNDDPKTKYDQDYIIARLSLSCYYYFSPQLRFLLNVGENYGDTSYVKKYTDGTSDDKIKMKNFSSSINASFIYSIF